MSVYDNLKSYFDRYIKPYLPYKGNKVFQSICAVLKDLFFKDSYQKIPQDLSTFVEDQKVTSPLYNKLLIGNGYPYRIVETITEKDKVILLTHLMHYQNDQGDLHHFKQIANLFKDNFNIYELYADYRIVTSNNARALDWVMATKSIYKCNDEPNPIYDYDAVYNATPTYFLSRQQIDYWRLTDSLVLPFKTNLMSLEWQNITSYNSIDSIVSANVYSYFQYQTLSIEVNNKSYIITVGDLYQLFYYLNFYVEGQTFINDTVFQMVNINIRGTPVFDFNSSGYNSIEEFIQKSEEVHDAETFQNFYSGYISSNYNTFLTGNGLTLNDIRLKLNSKIGTTLLTDLEHIIDSAPDKLTGLYNAILLLENALDVFIDQNSDPNAQKYKYWLKLFLNTPNINPKNTTTFKLILQFKPYHTQLILLERYKLKYRKDNCWIRDDVFFVDHNYEHSAVVLSDDYYLKQYILHDSLTPCFKFQNDPPGIRHCGNNLILQYVEIGSMISLCIDKEHDIYESVQFIDWDVEKKILTNDQYNSLLALFPSDSYKYQFIEETYNDVTPCYTRDFYKRLALKNKNYYYYFKDQFIDCFNFYYNDVIHQYDSNIDVYYDTIIDTITNTKLQNSLKAVLKYTNYKLWKKSDLVNKIDEFKYFFRNLFKDFNIKIQFLPIYTINSKEYYDVNNLNGLINELFPTFDFKFKLLQIEKTFPLINQNPVLSTLNYIKFQFNQDIKLGHGIISLLYDMPENIEIIYNPSVIIFNFNKQIKKGVGKLLLQPKYNYSINLDYTNNPTKTLNIIFNKNINLNNGKIILEPVKEYISKSQFQIQFQELVSAFNYFIAILEASLTDSKIIPTTNSKRIISEKFNELIKLKVENNTDLIYLSKYLDYWEKFKSLTIVATYKTVNYNQFNDAYIDIESQLKYTSTEKVDIWNIITQDEECVMLTDREWTGPIDECFPYLVVTTLPPVEDVVYLQTGLFTFTNVESAKYVHTNKEAFLSIYIGDYIWVVQDTKKYAVKVIGKDLNEMNLKLDKTYRGTAGSFNAVGRYRSGFYKQHYNSEDDFI